MSEPIAYHITWTTYGTWLPGDARGWVKKTEAGIHAGRESLKASAERGIAQAAVTLSDAQRQTVEETIHRHCHIRGWEIHALNVRTNHVHVIVSAPEVPEKVMGEFKAWCSRKLNEMAGVNQKWWTHHGSTKWINDGAYLENAIRYVVEGQ
ncbi:MAG: transposase [Planctomycetes bacterium]|nr:transposase [Planctomycetota bacterium]